MELNQYTIFIFIMGLAVGSIITSLLHLFFFKRTMRKINSLNRDNNYLTSIVKDKFKGRIIGKNF